MFLVWISEADICQIEVCYSWIYILYSFVNVDGQLCKLHVMWKMFVSKGLFIVWESWFIGYFNADSFWSMINSNLENKTVLSRSHSLGMLSRMATDFNLAMSIVILNSLVTKSESLIIQNEMYVWHQTVLISLLCLKKWYKYLC